MGEFEKQVKYMKIFCEPFPKERVALDVQRILKREIERLEQKVNMAKQEFPFAKVESGYISYERYLWFKKWFGE